MLNYSSGAAGSSSHLAAELFKSMAGVDIVRIAYAGTQSELNDLLSGYVQLTFGNAATVGPHIKTGKLRALAVTTAEPSVLLPGVPAISASGLPGYESAAMNAIFAPAKTPDVIIKRLNQEIARAVHLPDIKEKFLKTGAAPVGSSSEQLAAAMKSEITRLNGFVLVIETDQTRYIAAIGTEASRYRMTTPDW